jgi:6-phosphogluconolactonase
MGSCELMRFAGPEELAREAARAWLQEMAATSGATSPRTVALSGGRIAGRFFAEVAELAKKQTTRLDAVHFFWSDERCVPPNDAESNFRLAAENLLTPLRIGESQIHRIRGELTPAMAASGAESDMRSVAPSGPNGQPVLELVLLGVGEEGHVASLFPGETAETMNNSAVFRAVTVPKPPPQRITMGYLTIASARQCWVLASGAAKQGALRSSLSPTGRTPLARVIQMRNQTRIWTDLAADEPSS